MSNIEEDIKILKTFNPGDEYTGKIKTAIDNILSEREQDKKRIKELEEENKLLLNGKVGVDLSYDDYIPKQKVKDKIEYYKKLQNNYIKKYDEVNDILQGMVNVLKELLEEK